MSDEADTALPGSITTEMVQATERPKFLRHKEKGFFKLKRDCWGERYEPAKDPEGVDGIPGELWLPQDFVRVPAEQWSRIVKLYFDLCDPSNKVADSRSEVSVVFARKGPDFKEWRTFVPKQTVGGASVDADLTKLVDIVTGEEFNGFPENWFHAGSSHSHNTMSAFFSGTDDRNELDVPGLHVVVGHIVDEKGKRKSYVPLASIVSAKVRRIVPFDQVLDVTPMRLDQHPKVMDYISKQKYTYTSDTPARGYMFGEDDDGLQGYLQWYRNQKANERTETTSIKTSEPASEKEPKFQKEIDAECRDAAFNGDQAAMTIRLSVMSARRKAKSMGDKQGRTIHRLCDAVQACRMDKAAFDVVWALLMEVEDALKAGG